MRYLQYLFRSTLFYGHIKIQKDYFRKSKNSYFYTRFFECNHKVWCGRGDLNPQGLIAHWDLNPARLPIPPLPQSKDILQKQLTKTAPVRKASQKLGLKAAQPYFTSFPLSTKEIQQATSENFSGKVFSLPFPPSSLCHSACLF